MSILRAGRSNINYVCVNISRLDSYSTWLSKIWRNKIRLYLLDITYNPIFYWNRSCLIMLNNSLVVNSWSSEDLPFDITHDWSSHRRSSVKKGVIRNFAKFTGKHLCHILFFNKVTGWGSDTGVPLWILQNF